VFLAGHDERHYHQGEYLMASKWVNRKSKKAGGWHGPKSKGWQNKFAIRLWRRTKKANV
jgi:hypothetical protein